MPSILKVDQIATVDNSSSVTIAGMATQINKPYAEFAYASNGTGSDITIAANNNTTKVSYTRVVYSNQISSDVANLQWSHGQTGIYRITVTYRQSTGADIWMQYAVYKNSPSALAGTSVRCGSVNSSHAATYEFYYTVDSTTAGYSLYGWANGTITVAQAFGGTSSSFSGTTGDIIKIIIQKVS
jgi:hypothetical protein